MPIFAFSRRWRALAVLPVASLLMAAKMSVGPLPETMIGVEVEGVPMREKIVVREGDVILRAKIFDTEVVTVDEDVSVAIAKFSHDIPAGTRLDAVLVDKRTEGLTGTSGRIYCGENQRTRSQFMEAMIGDWFSKYETVVRFCFVDTDNDKKLDQVFLAGAKDKADQGAVAIEPVAFTRRMFQEDDDAGLLELRVERLIRKKKEVDKIEFKLHLTRGEMKQGFSYIMTVENGAARQTYPTMMTNPRKVAYPSYFNNIMGAAIGVHSVDAEAGTAEVEVINRFPMQLFKPITIQVNYVYIYY